MCNSNLLADHYYDCRQHLGVSTVVPSAQCSNHNNDNNIVRRPVSVVYMSYRMCAIRRKGQPASMLSGQLTNVVRHTMTSSMLFCPSNRVYMFTFGKTVRTGQWAVINAYARAHAHTHATWWPMTVSLKGVRILNGLWKWDAYIIQIMILEIYELWSNMSACVSTTSLVFKSKHEAFGLGQKSNNFNADLWISME